MIELDQETINSFIMEFREHIEEVIRYVLLLENNHRDTESVHALFRNFHSIKGNAGVLEFEKISCLSHEAETLLDSIREQTVQINSDIIEILLTTADTLTALVDEVQGSGSFDQSKLNDLMNTISSYLPRGVPLKRKEAPGQGKRIAISAGSSTMENKILVVDDEKAICDMLERAFTKAGYTVRCAGSGEEAVGVLKQENIQVMFLDLKLPEMSGVDLCRQIRKDKPIAIIYAITGYTSLFELADCREVGFDDYFTKPVELKVLLKAAEDAFEKLDRWKKR